MILPKKQSRKDKIGMKQQIDPKIMNKSIIYLLYSTNRQILSQNFVKKIDVKIHKK